MVSERCKLPLKVATALSLAIVGALWLGWDKPYWAGFAVVVMSVTETTGHSLRKGRHRLVGTLIGVISAFLFVGLFAQEPFIFLLTFTSFAACCVYLMANPRTGYIWTMTLIVCTLIIVMGHFSAELTFTVAVLRLQETILGIVCFTLVFSLLWPASSRKVLHSTLLSFFVAQQRNIEKTVAGLEGRGERGQGLGFGDGLKFLIRLEDLLPAAIVDSYHISSEAKTWQLFLAQSREWALLCGHLSEASELLEPAMVNSEQQEIQALLIRISCRFASAEAALCGTVTNDNPIPEVITLRDKAIYDPQHHSALLQLEQVLNALDLLSCNMLKTLCAALTLDTLETLEMAVISNPPSQFAGLDLEPLCQALRAWVIIWICIGLWLFVPWTGGSTVALMGVILGSAIVSMPFCDVKMVFRNMVGWSCVILLQYVFLMPLFSEVWQLAAFYFLNCFAIWYWFSKPQQVLSRMLGTQLLIVMTMGAIKLQPVYDFQGALLQLFLMSVVVLIVYFVNYTLFSSLPERVFLRHIKWLYYLFAWQLRRLNFKDKKEHWFSRCIGLIFLGQSPLRSVMLMEQAIARIDWSRYPEVDREQVTGIISRLYALTLRLISLHDGYVGWEPKSIPPQVATLLADIVTSLSDVIECTGDIESLQLHEDKLDQLQVHLQQCVKNVNSDSVLLLSLNTEQVLYLFRILAAIKLIIRDIKRLDKQVSSAKFSELEYNYFSL